MTALRFRAARSRSVMIVRFASRRAVAVLLIACTALGVSMAASPPSADAIIRGTSADQPWAAYITGSKTTKIPIIDLPWETVKIIVRELLSRRNGC